MLIHKEIRGHELYLYMNGKLIYKRWLDTGASKVFDVMAYDKYTIASLRDIGHQEKSQCIQVKALIKLKTTEEGGRKTGILSGYRPNHVFEYDKNCDMFETYMGDIIWDDLRAIEPGEEEIVTVRLSSGWKIERYLNIGRKWWIHEGPKCLGEAKLIEFL